MTNAINVKKITSKDVTATYDLLMGFYQENPDRFQSEDDMGVGVARLLTMTLNDIRYPLAAKSAAILRTHKGALKNGKSRPVLFDDASDNARALFEAVSGEKAPAKASAAGVETTEAGEAARQTASTGTSNGTGDETPAPTVEQKDISMTRYTVDSAAAESLVDPLLSIVSGETATSIQVLLDTLSNVSAAADAHRTLVDAYDTAIAAYGAGQQDVDESVLIDLPAFRPSGYATAPLDSAVLASLDVQIKSAVSPEITYSDIIMGIRAAEEDITRSITALKTKKRELRAARPKKRIQLAAAPSAAVDATDGDTAALREIEASLEIEMTPATDIFPDAFGTTSPILGFDIPKLVFDEDHPDVPEVDNTFCFYSPVLAEALHAITANEIIWLHGESGCGKSEFWAQVAARLGMPFTRINFDAHLTRSDVVGVNRLVPGPDGAPVMKFIEGLLPRAMQQPGICLLDELDLGDPEIMPILQPVLEGKGLRLMEDGGRLVRPHPMFRIAITGNTIGLGSDNQMYLNAFEQSAATRDRISAFVQMPYLPADVEKDVVMSRVPDADEIFIERVIQLANKVREGYRQGEVGQLFSSRAVLYCASRHARFADLYNDPNEAALAVLETVILGRMDNTSHQVVKGMVDNIFV